MKSTLSKTLEYILEQNEKRKMNRTEQYIEDQRKKLRPMVLKIQDVDVISCVYCGNDHLELDVLKLEQPIEWYNHKAICPETNKPIFIKFVYS